MDRRNFLKVVAASATVMAVSPSMIRGNLYAADGTLFKAYDKVQLVDAAGKPIKASALAKEVTYIFNYPHASTPCMLINLPKGTSKEVELASENGEKYVWKSGVGKERSIVAYVAICTHQMTHPTPNDSFITYVPTTKKTMAYDKGGVIVCSSHLSAFDAGAGAKVLGGAATQPLNSVVLEHAADDTLWAVGILGSDKFQDYFKSFRPELKEFYGGPAEAKKLVSISAKTVKLTEYSKEIIQY
ncbi:MAG: sulfur oxidation protein [Sulfuricurvum sp. RIFOXYD2_FULL_44_160]|uniref:Sulfur oxidation protein n=3 Tax=Sulfuricurvum TaxID=286130 RepID=A0A2D3WLW7_9BACT|nr:Rieske 2Fe-2S domain-containing protein [Sulfuricurvum kujiense]OHD97520.1 MAG: sulfur oxidation protein [Sulfuricurvum sp. RIFOXYD2_FULL_44_160]DAB39306.1 MAG TPA: sulfur oxidation protein [Sulfuricurvum kujiense]